MCPRRERSQFPKNAALTLLGKDFTGRNHFVDRCRHFLEQEATLNALAVEAFNDRLKKHGKRQSVENRLLD
jgi:hypothetical protein